MGHFMRNKDGSFTSDDFLPVILDFSFQQIWFQMSSQFQLLAVIIKVACKVPFVLAMMSQRSNVFCGLASQVPLVPANSVSQALTTNRHLCPVNGPKLLWKSKYASRDASRKAFL